jgi:hypothetical protein
LDARTTKGCTIFPQTLRCSNCGGTDHKLEPFLIWIKTGAK